MLSIQKKFLFIHIPKTGGASIQTALKDYSEDNVYDEIEQDGTWRFAVENDRYGTRMHFMLCEYERVLEPALFSSLFKFAE